MQKKLVSILALLLTAVLVVGCNTSDKTGDSDAQQNEPSNTAPIKNHLEIQLVNQMRKKKIHLQEMIQIQRMLNSLNKM